MGQVRFLRDPTDLPRELRALRRTVHLSDVRLPIVPAGLRISTGRLQKEGENVLSIGLLGRIVFIQYRSVVGIAIRE